MPIRVVGTGVELRLGEPFPHQDPSPDEVVVAAQTYAEIVGNDEGRFRCSGPVLTRSISGDGDPTSEPIAIAYGEREANLGTVLGDLRIHGDDVTRFELYAAPFRVVLADDLREQLRGRWRGRAPQS